jgi:ABC-type Fe3+-hydroxamate transport system substrate-binding protein
MEPGHDHYRQGAQASVYNLITTDSKWAELKAVKDGKVYIRPSDPFSWFDGPPGSQPDYRPVLDGQEALPGTDRRSTT